MVAAVRVHDFAPGPNGCTLCGLERRNTAHWHEPLAAQHSFTPRRTDGSSAFLGPPEETCHHCGSDPRNVVHNDRLGALGVLVAIEPPIFTSPIPGGTYCELCGRLRHTHVDDRCVSKPVRSRARRDESTEAQLAYALQCLASLVRHVRKVSGYAVPEDQEALREAEALLVEVKG